MAGDHVPVSAYPVEVFNIPVKPGDLTTGNRTGIKVFISADKSGKITHLRNVQVIGCRRPPDGGGGPVSHKSITAYTGSRQRAGADHCIGFLPVGIIHIHQSSIVAARHIRQCCAACFIKLITGHQPRFAAGQGIIHIVSNLCPGARYIPDADFINFASNVVVVIGKSTDMKIDVPTIRQVYRAGGGTFYAIDIHHRSAAVEGESHMLPPIPAYYGAGGNHIGVLGFKTKFPIVCLVTVHV